MSRAASQDIYVMECLSYVDDPWMKYWSNNRSPGCSAKAGPHTWKFNCYLLTTNPLSLVDGRCRRSNGSSVKTTQEDVDFLSCSSQSKCAFQVSVGSRRAFQLINCTQVECLTRGTSSAVTNRLGNGHCTPCDEPRVHSTKFRRLLMLCTEVMPTMNYFRWQFRDIASTIISHNGW